MIGKVLSKKEEAQLKQLVEHERRGGLSERERETYQKLMTKVIVSALKKGGLKVKLIKPPKHKASEP